VLLGYAGLGTKVETDGRFRSGNQVGLEGLLTILPTATTNLWLPRVGSTRYGLRRHRFGGRGTLFLRTRAMASRQLDIQRIPFHPQSSRKRKTAGRESIGRIAHA
jgi:hypothetical protein